jgi:broad specificity phosphatase PhoE
MKIYFIRHGQTESNRDGFMAGQSEPKLTEEGKEEVKNAILQLPNGCSVIYSSDLIRCRQTTEILNERLNLPVFYDTRLRERHIGSLEGRNFIDFLANFPEKDEYGQYNFTSFGGEASETLKNRLLSCIADIKKEKKGDKILVVTSGGVIHLLYAVFKKLTLERIHNSSIHEFEFE